MTSFLSEVSPLCRILIQLQTDSVFNLFFASLLEIGGNKNQYTVAGDLEACELQGLDPGRAACSAALSRGPWEYHQRPRAGHRFRSGARAERQGIYCPCTKTEKYVPCGTRGASHLLSSFLFFPPPFLRIVAASSVFSHRTPLPTPFGWYTGSEPVIMPTLQIWAQNISTTGSVIIR